MLRPPRARRVRVRRFELALPRSVDDCLKTLAQRGADAKLVAGGTDLLPQMKNGLVKPALVVDLSGSRRCDASRRPAGPSRRRGGVGPRARAGPAGAEGLSRAGRERRPRRIDPGPQPGDASAATSATPRPSADMAPPLMALEAEAVIAGPRGSAGCRWRTSSRASGAPCSRPTSCWWSSSCPRRARAAAVLPPPHAAARAGHRRRGVASQLTLSNGVCVKARIALAAVAPTPVRATGPRRRWKARP